MQQSSLLRLRGLIGDLIVNKNDELAKMSPTMVDYRDCVEVCDLETLHKEICADVEAGWDFSKDGL